jgi:hypothetical protein
MIQGDVSIFLSALGAREGDPRLERALALVGGEAERDTFDEDDVQATYLVFAEQGVEFLLNYGQLSSVFIYARATDEQSVYGDAATLVDGVDFSASQGDLVAALGAPKRSTDRYVLYAADPGFVQFDFDGDELTLVVVMQRDIGG